MISPRHSLIRALFVKLFGRWFPPRPVKYISPEAQRRLGGYHYHAPDETDKHETRNR